MTFTFRSGDLALDFAGTVGHRDTDRYDLISSPDAFGAWAVAAGSSTPHPQWTRRIWPAR